MSGGVDSSVAAYQMKKQGYECIGATMKLFHNEEVGVPREHTCCSSDDVRDARSVAQTLDILYYVFNFSDSFKKDVIDRFVTAYENGRTPNPCIDCNRYLKFEKMYQRAKELGYEYVATGHYARIEQERSSGRYWLKKAVDQDKDQSYVLYTMTQEQLQHTRFPLGDMTKTEVRKIAAEAGFINAQKHDSQDICFVQNGDYADFIERYTGRRYPAGPFLDRDGHPLGQHRGVIRYTIGQRKGLGLSLPEPMYVLTVDPAENTVTLGKEPELYARRLTATDINLIAVTDIARPMRLKVRTRYHQREQWATVVQTEENEVSICFDVPQRAITKGQAAVFYDGDIVIGGGTIHKAE